MPARENRLMSLVHLPLTSTDPPSPAVAGATVRAMEIGQHLMAVVLTAIGVIRAIGDGVGMPAAIQIAANPSSHHTARLREWVFDGRIVPAVCQPRIAMPEMIAAGVPTPSPIARMTPMAVSTTAMRC